MLICFFRFHGKNLIFHQSAYSNFYGGRHNIVSIHKMKELIVYHIINTKFYIYQPLRSICKLMFNIYKLQIMHPFQIQKVSIHFDRVVN